MLGGSVRTFPAGLEPPTSSDLSLHFSSSPHSPRVLNPRSLFNLFRSCLVASLSCILPNQSFSGFDVIPHSAIVDVLCCLFPFQPPSCPFHNTSGIFSFAVTRWIKLNKATCQEAIIALDSCKTCGLHQRHVRPPHFAPKHQPPPSLQVTFSPARARAQLRIGPLSELRGAPINQSAPHAGLHVHRAGIQDEVICLPDPTALSLIQEIPAAVNDDWQVASKESRLGTVRICHRRQCHLLIPVSSSPTHSRGFCFG